MADLLPRNFQQAPVNAVASYPYSEVAEGTGITKYYGSKVSISNSSASDVYILTTDASIIPTATSTSKTTTETIDIDFDVEFQAPKKIQGYLFVVMPMSISDSDTITPTIYVRKWDGTTETNIVNASPPVLTSGAGTVYEDRILRIDVPATIFGAGDSLRITFSAPISGSGATGTVYHDPTGGQTANFPNSDGIFSVWVPFKLEL